MARNKEFVPEKALDAALHQFWERGYEATSMQELVDCTGLSRSSLYDTFGDKHALFLAALDKYTVMGEAKLCQQLSAFNSPKQTIQHAFSTLVENTQTAEEPPGCFMVASMVELGAHDGEVAARAQATLYKNEQLLRVVIERGQQLGEITTRLSAQMLARHLLNAIRGIVTLAKVQPDLAHLKDIVAVTLAVLEP